jgi:transcriptional regulator GlxA family with amidase domain
MPQNSAVLIVENHNTMSRVTKISTILTASNTERVEALCVWIAENCDSSIGWEQLSKQSGLSHKELISLFQIHKHQTPMAYIKNVREQKKKDLPRYPQATLFNSINKTGNEEG